MSKAPMMPTLIKLNLCSPVSPEVLGFLTAIGLFIILMTFLFWYLNNKLALENPGSLQCLDDFRKKTELQGESTFFIQGLFVVFSASLDWFHVSGNSRGSDLFPNNLTAQDPVVHI